MNWELMRRGLAAQRRGIIGWSIALLLLAVTSMSAWPAMQSSGGLDTLLEGIPPEMLAAFGIEDLSTASGYLGANFYALICPILIAVMAILHMNALTAADEDAGRMELLLALPVSRGTVYLSRFVSVAVVVVFEAVLVGVIVWASAPVFDMELSTTGIAAVTAGVALLGLFHTALTLALAAWGLRSGAVLGISFAVLVAGYFVYAILPISGSLEKLAEFTPWYWAIGNEPLADGFGGWGLLYLGIGVVVFVVLALIGVSRRSIRTA